MASLAAKASVKGPRKGAKRRRAPVRRIIRQDRSSRHWPSEAEQTLHALRAGLIDALVIPEGPRDGVYALRTFEELEQANSQLRESQERLLILLSERERLMQDLHDGCIQSIYAIGLALEDCRGLIAEDPAHATKKVAQAAASLNLVIQELRAFISAAPPVAHVDLPQEIARIIEGLGTHGPRFHADVDKALADTLPHQKAAQLLQIAREALSNIVRHANAKVGRISLRKRGSKVRLEVVDDGRGFDKNAAAGMGLGLHHIAARVQKLGGKLQLTSKPAHGCRICVEIAI
jgi:signal transduction histidine kinase